VDIWVRVIDVDVNIVGVCVVKIEVLEIAEWVEEATDASHINEGTRVSGDRLIWQ
jgi:hypothetical protein